MTHSYAAQAGITTPENSEAGHRANGAGPLDQPTPLHSAVPVPRDQGKTYFTLRAQAALRGYSLSRSHPEDGPTRFYVSRWGLLRELRDLAAVAAFVEQIGAAA